MLISEGKVAIVCPTQLISDLAFLFARTPLENTNDIAGILFISPLFVGFRVATRGSNFK